MAKNIKQMANEAADKFGGGKWDRAIYSDGYKAGANAVLEEIEKCLDNPSMIQGYSDILAKVQELKGE